MYNRKDHYWHRAKREGYRSRAAYKLEDLQKRYRFIRAGDAVVDLGCAPGGWLQVLADQVGPSGRVFGIDRLEVRPFPQSRVVLLRGDIRDTDCQLSMRRELGGRVQVVTSDMSPDLSGVGFQDHIRACELVRCGLSFAREVLVPGGNFVAKIFEGEELNDVVAEMKRDFREVRRVVPTASRKASSEIYLIAKGFFAGSRG